MNIRDAMAEAILRDVLANPGKYPGDWVDIAQDYAFVLHDNGGTCAEGWPNCFGQWKGVLSGLSSKAADSPEDQPEDNGNQEPDARDFQE